MRQTESELCRIGQTHLRMYADSSASGTGRGEPRDESLECGSARRSVQNCSADRSGLEAVVRFYHDGLGLPIIDSFPEERAISATPA